MFEVTPLVVIGTDCTGSCKPNYHTITCLWVTRWMSYKKEGTEYSLQKPGLTPFSLVGSVLLIFLVFRFVFLLLFSFLSFCVLCTLLLVYHSSRCSDQYIFHSFFKEQYYKNKCKDLIGTSKFKFSFRELVSQCYPFLVALSSYVVVFSVFSEFSLDV